MKLGKINRQSIGISGFTSVLSTIPTPPKELYVIGRLPADHHPTVAIVGSRRPTAYGIEVTHRLATDLARAGVVVVSGLAFGIDAIAHTAAVEAGGETIAVLAGGLHAIYPAAHRGLAEQIIKSGGAIISEQAKGVEAHKYHFLSRNRLVSGLADALIVTEATERSGTLSTVSHALEQGREVFAVPGPITSLLSAGPNRLLQQGAHPVVSARDVLEVIAPQLLKPQTQLLLGANEVETSILQLLQHGAQPLEAIEQKINLTAAELSQALTMLELSGMIRNLDGRWSLR